ncbi:MAG: cytochrome c biogenesis protein CcdA [Burkholderiaceae bacterium]
MGESGVVNLVALPIFFGLFGFIEPCSIGSTLVMVKQMEGRSRAQKIAQMLMFAGTRAIFIGLLGVVAAYVGSAFLGFQKAAWLLLGVFYVVLGGLYLSGRAGLLMRTFGPRLDRLRSLRGAAALGLFFGLNIPACAAPLILALLGLAAAGGASATDLGGGFVSLALFGLALSLPLVAAVLFAPARALLDRLAALSKRIPRWTGFVLVLLGLWSIWFGVFVSIAP